MKPVIIIAMALVLFLVPITAYADVKVSGTTISGSSDASIVRISISNSDGQNVWEETVSVNETFEIELPRLEHGKYTLSMKHGAIGGEQEVIEFTYTGPEPIVSNFTIDIIYSDLPVTDGLLAEYNNALNWQKLKPLILESNYPLELLDVIFSELSELINIADQELRDIQQYNPDGTETKEYLDAWMNNYVYYRFDQDYVRGIIDRVNDGMSLETAISQVEPLAEKYITKYLAQTEPQTQIDPPSLQPDTGPSDTSIQKIPSWVKSIFLWYGQDQVSEDELLNAIKYLINEKILIVE